MLKTPRREPESLSPFECAAGDPAAWQEAAHNLIGCANIILDTLRVRQGQDGPAGSAGTGAFWRTPMMLYGLAVENLIKAIIVARKPASDVCFPLSDGAISSLVHASRSPLRWPSAPTSGFFGVRSTCCGG